MNPLTWFATGDGFQVLVATTFCQGRLWGGNLFTKICVLIQTDCNHSEISRGLGINAVQFIDTNRSQSVPMSCLSVMHCFAIGDGAQLVVI